MDALFVPLCLFFGLCLGLCYSQRLKKLVSTIWITSPGQPFQVNYFAATGVRPPTPLPKFNIESAKPRPYRPFRWGYHQTMSLSPMEPDWWIELESTYRERIEQRQRLYKEHGKTVIDSLPGSEAACQELLEMVVRFLCVRYPNQFELDSKTRIFQNHILGTISDLTCVEPLEFLLNHVPEDFLITEQDMKTGLYYLRAGVSCSAVGWSMSTKIGKPLAEIHGPVPYYKEKLKASMDRYFTKMTCDKPIQRGSWGLEIGQPLFLQTDDPDFAARSKQAPDLEVEDIYLRVDWQTLRRLPQSRAIVFNFKALFTPLVQLQNEPYIPRLLAKVLRDGPKPILEYKGSWHVEHKALPALDAWSKEQEQKGWVPKDWEERTLDEHPLFPGWQ
ncbi:hypothetical protein BDQ12DRAFT_676759 [Crucibulum laeve]|uniref:HRQ family protein n=1 Tax=Crucibulum laeve TaxID=68775 RepID=A0A5C3MEB1_9AGAR|nr:hypothetical protein BDQ12DRAFT_676759 [Crucibulum laeve]